MKLGNLVSVAIVSYNSQQFILETLESVENQTYKNIQLVISDDNSKDNTVSIIEEWIKEKKYKFKEIIFIKSAVNTGISANINRALLKCTGEYVKILAGDDILYDECIIKNINFVNENENRKIVFSNALKFSSNNSNMGKFVNKMDMKVYNKSAKQQYRKLLRGNFIPAITGFYETKTIKEIGFDEKYKCVEDYQCWIKATKRNIKLHYFDEVTVKYRIHENSASNIKLRNTDGKELAYNKTSQEIMAFTEENVLNQIINEKMFLTYISRKLELFVFKYTMKRGNYKKIYSKVKLIRIVDPYSVINKIKQFI